MTTPKTNQPWLTVDIKGFAQVLRNKGIARIALEPISNAFDTEATEIDVEFSQVQGWADLTVMDDDPNGFSDLRDAYTLFAPSTRRNDPTKRGRFGQGEKELVAICATGGEIVVQSTTGMIIFEKTGRRSTNDKRPQGTVLRARFRCVAGEARDFERLVRALLIPAGVKVTFNDETLVHRDPIKTVRETLPTKIVDDEGNLSDSRRITDIDLIEVADGETPTIYELGVPVVEHDGRWHVNVLQKVPLNTARDNVTPSYLRRLREIMLNETYQLLTSVDMKSAWVTEALPEAAPEALRAVVEGIHGKKSVIYDPSNPEATKRALDQGYTVIYGRQFTADTWSKIKEHDVTRPAGQVIPTGVPTSPDGMPPIPVEDWTPSMHAVADYVQALGVFLLPRVPKVRFSMARVGKYRAGWSDGITFYLSVLGKRWCEKATEEQIDELVIHEFTHNWVQDHYSDAFILKLGNLGARLRNCESRLADYRK